MNYKKVSNLLEEAKVKARLSPDSNTKVGCIITDKEGGNILSSYNGFISGAKDSKLPSVGEEKYKYMIHAEENAICRAAKRGISLDGTILFCTLSPCEKCLRLIYQVGIRTVYFETKYKNFDTYIQTKDLDVCVQHASTYYKLTLKPKEYNEKT
jgi:dCMP deaminase